MFFDWSSILFNANTKYEAEYDSEDFEPKLKKLSQHLLLESSKLVRSKEPIEPSLHLSKG